ncbi:MAG: general secretion pathway protein GspB [Candidatus Omnitrophica bacterium]|nr:general secretion pathway protein GspB [Candidatus Omnitrophota bacterium]
MLKKLQIEKLGIFPLLLIFIFIGFSRVYAEAEKKIDYPTVEYQPIKRDPFHSPLDILDKEVMPEPAETEITLPQMSLQGWTWGYEPRAIINNQVVKKGDKISGAEVLEIRKEGVILIYQGKVFTIRPKK